METKKLYDAIEAIKRLNKEQNFRTTMFNVYKASAKRIVLRIEKMDSSKTPLEACKFILHDALIGNIRLNPVDHIQIKLIVRYFETGHAFRIQRISNFKNYPRYGPFQSYLREFLHFLSENCKSRYTIESYRNVLSQFLNHLSNVGCRKITNISACHINSFFKLLTKTWAITSIRVASSAMRSFIMYIESDSTLIYALPKHCPKHFPIIPVLTKEEDKLLKEYIINDNASYKNKSIIALCYYLGIRAIDIINLKLSDVDWNKDLISFIQSKTGENIVLPLMPIIGNCIAQYILQERPESHYTNIFLREIAPICPYTEHSSVYNQVSQAFKKLGIRTNERQGSHLLRHSLASRQISSGTTLGIISTLLGHSNIDSTTIYLSIDYEGMRKCCIDPIFRSRRSS